MKIGALSGSLTKLKTGESYLAAGENVTITTASNGQITISSTGGGGGGGGGFFSSTTAGSAFTTGSIAFVGGEAGIDSPSDKGTDVFFYVSGSISGSSKAVFGGDVRISGALALGQASAYIRVENEPGSIVFSPHPDTIIVGSDTFFYVSGSPGDGDKSVFGGDVRVSGTLSIGTGSVIITSNNIQFGSPSARFELEGGSIKVYDATNPTGSLLGGGGGGGGESTFTNDITVSLSGGKTFGRYANGEIIPATGKTAREVILLVSAEPINPTVSLNGTNPITSAFNTTALTSSLTGNYTINSLGASVSAARLQWRSGSSGNWNILSTSTTNPLNYSHTLDVPNFFTTALNYQYIITDSVGAIATGSLTITPQAYAAPSISLTVAATSPGGVTSESNSKREKGNVSSTITGTITRNRANVPISSYSVQYQVNGAGSWTDVPGLSNVSVVGNPSSVSIPSTVHDDAALKSSTSLVYRVQVVDSYQTTTSSSSTVSFLNVIFYGPSSSAPTTSSDVRALSSKIFTDGSNPFTLNTGNTNVNFTAAMPATLSISSVVDLDALNAVITNSYVSSTFNVNDAGGTAVSYKVYTMTIASPYASNHRHQITRA